MDSDRKWHCLTVCWLAAACLALLAAPACTPVTAPVNDAPDLVVAAPRGALSVTLETAAAAYAQAGGAVVRVEALGAEEYNRQVSAALLAGLDRFDLVYLPAEDLARWAGYHAIQPLSAGLDEAALKPWLPAVTISHRWYGLPTQPDPVVLWYRADLLEAAGLPVPQDWEALRQAAAAFRSAAAFSRDARQVGMVTAGSDLDAGADFAAVLAGFGGEMVSAQYQVEMDGETARRALEAYVALSPPGAQRYTRADVQAALRDGRAVLGMAPYSAGKALLDCAASPGACREGRPLLAWTQMPGLKPHQAAGSLGVWAIPLRAAHAAQAQRFAAWLGGEAGARAWLRAGGVPAHVAVLAGQAEAHPLRQVVEYRLSFPPVATADLLARASNSAVNAAVSGKLPPDRALEAAAGQMRQALRQAGYPLEE